jgi:hypothetical protein
VAYSRGALYALLNNRLYLGEIAYRGQIYPGEHIAIIAAELWERVQQQLAGTRKARHEGDPQRTPSLLLGLIYDENGQRYTPSHTRKGSKRYRYYVAQAPRQDARMARIPAEELETLVLQRLLRWLSDQLALLDALSAPADDAAVLQGLLAAASARCQAWSKLAPEQLRGFVRAVMVKITIALDTIVIALNKSALRTVLLPAAAHGDITSSQEAEDDLIQLTIEARVQRRGRAVRLVVTPLEASAAAAPASPALLNVLAQGHHWLEQLLRGEVCSLRSIAKSAGVSERYVSQVIHAAFLAPDLVEAVLQGRQPTQLTRRQLMKGLPCDWSEQRRMFGLAQGVPPRMAAPEGAGAKQ